MDVYVIVVLCALLGAEGFNTKADIHYFKTCSKKYNLIVTELRFYYHALIRSVENVDLLSECYFRGMGYIDKKQNIIYSKLKNTRYYMNSLQQSGDLIDRCTPTNGNTVGEKVSILMECVLKEMYKFLNDIHNKPKKPKEQRTIQTCAVRSNLPTLQLEKYFSILTANSQTIQIFSECYLLEQGYLDNRGNLLPEIFKYWHTSRSTIVPFSILIDQCKSEKGTTVAETSYKFLNCLFNQTKVQQQEELGKQQRATVVCARKYKLPIRNLQDYIRAASKYNDQLQLYSKCYLTKLGYVNITVKILYDHIKKISTPYISLEQYSTFVDVCKNELGDNIIEMSHKFLTCFLFNIHKMHTKIRSNLSHTEEYEGMDTDQRQIEHVQQQFEKRHMQFDEFRQLVKQHAETIELLQYRLSQLQVLPKINKEQPELLEQQDQLQTDFKQQFQKQKGKFQQILQQIKKQQFQQQMQEDQEQHESLQEILSKQQNEELKMLHQAKKCQIALKICSATSNFLIQTVHDYNNAIIAGRPEVKSFSECYLRELAYLDNTGTILYEKVKKETVDSISVEEYSEIVGICQSVVENEGVENSYKFSKCVLLSINKIYQQQQLDLQQHPQQKLLVLLKTCAGRYNLPIQNFPACTRVLGHHLLRNILFSQCYLRGIACLSSNNSIIFEKVKKFTPPGVSRETYSNFVDFCKSAKAPGTIDISFAFLRCLQNYMYPQTSPKPVKQNTSPRPISQNKTDEEEDKEEEKQPKGKQSVDIDT
ncbi:hypothetical protein FQA39_LY15828 [Lamprigera yunnana]|nr:hypothetical protein FQA39_LY15828 [Lamprigera yunnana]